MAEKQKIHSTDEQDIHKTVFTNFLTHNGNISDTVKCTFEKGQLSFLGSNVEVLPQELVNKYSSITLQLDLSFNMLKSLEGLEHFLLLRELVLDNNELSDLVTFPYIKSLHTLTLNKNRFTDLHGLLEKLVKSFHSLTYLSLLGNQACPNQLSSLDKDDEDYLRYRYYVLYKIPGLKFLDSTPVTATEVAEAKRVGPYMKVVRPNENDSEEVEGIDSPDSSSRSPYTPLPTDATQDHMNHQAKSYWTKAKSKYVGRNSEGNRFITDRAL